MLGIIGGMGPLASSLFYDMVIERTGAKTDQGNLDLILLSHASMPDRTEAILSGNDDKIGEVRDKLLKDARFLAEAGCSAICVTCNTAHFFIDMIEDQIDIPFIHLIRETADEAKRKIPSGKIAVLATDGTVKTGLYQQELEKRRLEPYTPGPDSQGKVMAEIYDRVKAGLEADSGMWKDIEEEIKAAGCDAAILACTELSVVKRELELPDYYLDPMAIMADRAVEFFRARGEIE